MVKDIPDLTPLFHPDEPNPDYAAEIAIAAEKQALAYSDKIKQWISAKELRQPLRC